MAFASVPELRAFLRRGSVEIDAEGGQLLLELASQAIRDWTDQTIEAASSSYTFGVLPPTRVLSLPEVPVTGVSSVVEHGEELAPEHYEWTRAGLLVRRWTDWPRDAGAVTVTYSHGLTPAEVKRSAAWAVCLQVASRAALNPELVTQVQIGDYSRSWSPTGDGRTGRIELTDFEKAQLDRLRR